MKLSSGNAVASKIGASVKQGASKYINHVHPLRYFLCFDDKLKIYNRSTSQFYLLIYLSAQSAFEKADYFYYCKIISVSHFPISYYQTFLQQNPIHNFEQD